ncbi:MAG: phosphosulfolactate synthase [Verrucomicrobia subdivision 3 bacterium]|nr:phosphosulfolactate synthase [Limisphaerales bacterium]
MTAERKIFFRYPLEKGSPRTSGYVKNFGPDVNLFVDHSQIVQLEALRRGIWGTSDLWGRVARFAE